MAPRPLAPRNSAMTASRQVTTKAPVFRHLLVPLRQHVSELGWMAVENNEGYFSSREGREIRGEEEEEEERGSALMGHVVTAHWAV